MPLCSSRWIDFVEGNDKIAEKAEPGFVVYAGVFRDVDRARSFSPTAARPCTKPRGSSRKSATIGTTMITVAAIRGSMSRSASRLGKKRLARGSGATQGALVAIRRQDSSFQWATTEDIPKAVGRDSRIRAPGSDPSGTIPCRATPRPRHAESGTMRRRRPPRPVARDCRRRPHRRHRAPRRSVVRAPAPCRKAPHRGGFQPADARLECLQPLRRSVIFAHRGAENTPSRSGA